jgi:hypothetical protein
MLKCINQESKEFVTILDPRWKTRLYELRILDDLNRLVCPVCRQPVRLRAGKVRIWHFAHKHLQNCPFQFESPVLLQARAALYEWLLRCFSVEKVAVEKIIPDLPFPRHIDCWVDQEPVSVIYWIFDTRRPPGERAHLQQAFEASRLYTHPVFTTSMLHPDQLDPQHLFLSTTERAFMTASQYDQAIRGYTLSQGKTLHYLDSENHTLVSYRNLHLNHPPQEYSGFLLKTPLSNITPFPGNGEFVHPGEEQKLRKIQTESQILYEKQQRTIPSLLNRQVADRDEVLFPKPPAPSSTAITDQIKERNPFERNAMCRVCGNSTSDWITYDGKTDTCLCRNCYNKQNL